MRILELSQTFGSEDFGFYQKWTHLNWFRGRGVQKVTVYTFEWQRWSWKPILSNYFCKVMGCWAERLSASMQPAGLKIWTSSNYQKFPEAQWEQQWMDPQWVPHPPWATMWNNAEVYNLVVSQCRVISCEKPAIPKYNDMSTNWGVGSNLKIFWPPNRNRNTTTCQQIKIWAAMWNFCGHHWLPAPRKQQSADGPHPPLPKSLTSR